MFESEAAEYSETMEAADGIAELIRRVPRTASGKGLAPVPTSKNFVTFSDFRTALDKVGGQIKTNSDAITAVGTKLNSTVVSLKKEFEERRKEIEAGRRETNQKVQMLALLPLLMPPPSYTIPAGAIGVGAPANPVSLAPPQTGMMNALLPLLLIGGFGGSSGTGVGGGAEGGMDSTMLLVMALVLATPKQA